MPASVCVLFVYNQERRSNRFILRDIAISGPYTISVNIPTITYIINCISVSTSSQATIAVGFCTYQCIHHSSDPLQAHQLPRHTPAVAVLIVNKVPGNISRNASTHLHQAFVSHRQLARLPHHNIVYKHCPIRRGTPIVIVVGLQTSSPPPCTDKQRRLTLDDVADV